MKQNPNLIQRRHIVTWLHWTIYRYLTYSPASNPLIEVVKYRSNNTIVQICQNELNLVNQTIWTSILLKQTGTDKLGEPIDWKTLPDESCHRLKTHHTQGTDRGSTKKKNRNCERNSTSDVPKELSTHPNTI